MQVKIIDNPLQPQEIYEDTLQIQGYYTLGDLAKYYLYTDSLEGIEIQATVNGGKEINPNRELKNTDAVVLTVIPADGENQWLRIGATVALAVATYGVGSLYAGAFQAGTMFGSFSQLGTAAQLGYIGVTTATAMGGSYLINQVMPAPSMDTAGDSLDSSPTYGWKPQKNTNAEGTALPLLLGRRKITPPLISQRLKTEDNKQYYDLLFAVAEGPINSINDVFINGNPYESYPEIYVESRLGQKDQSIIPWFEDTYIAVLAEQKKLDNVNAGTAEVQIDEYLNKGVWSNTYTTTNTVSILKFNIRTPRLLTQECTSNYSYRDCKYYNGSITILLQYKKTSNSTWNETILNFSGYRYNHISKTVTGLESAQYDVRIKVLEADDGYYDDKTLFKSVSTASATSVTTSIGITQLLYDLTIGPLFQRSGGGTEPLEVVISCDYRKVGESNWQGKEIVVKEDTYSGENRKIRRQVEIQGLDPAQYECRVYYSEPPPSGTSYEAQAYWTALQESTGEKFSYPGVALLGVRALATDQLAGDRPRVECIASKDSDGYLFNDSISANANVALDPDNGTGYYLPAGGSWTADSTLFDGDGTTTLKVGAYNEITSIKFAFDTTRVIAGMDINLVSATTYYLEYRLSGSNDDTDYETIATYDVYHANSGYTLQEFEPPKIDPGNYKSYQYYKIDIVPLNIENSFSDIKQDIELSGIELHEINVAETELDLGLPAHQAYWMLVYNNVDTANIIDSEFSAWADFCLNPPAPDYDSNTTYSKGALVSYNNYTYESKADSNTGNTPSGSDSDNSYWARYRLRSNLYLDRGQSLQQCLNWISHAGRAHVVQRGVQWGVIIDEPGERVDIVNDADMIEGSFEESFISSDDMANIVEVAYFDETNNYEKTIVEVRAPDFDASTEEKRTQVTLYGVTNKTQAKQYGVKELNATRLQKRTAKWEQNIDAIRYQSGDIVGVQTEQTRWLLEADTASGTQGGVANRIVSATSSSVTLDRPADDLPQEQNIDYVILTRHLDDTLEQVDVAKDANGYPEITDNGDNTCTVTLANSWTTIPNQFDLYAYGEINHVVKDFRITKITRAGDQTRQIEAIEYVPELYVEDQILEPSTTLSTPPAVEGLQATEEAYRNNNGYITPAISLSWQGAGSRFQVNLHQYNYDSTDGTFRHTNFRSYETKQSNYYENVDPGFYDATIFALEQNNDTPGVQLSDTTVSNEPFITNIDNAIELNRANIPSDESFTVQDVSGTTYTEGTDYSVDYTLGTITALGGGSMTDGTEYYASYGGGFLRINDLAEIRPDVFRFKVQRSDDVDNARNPFDDTESDGTKTVGLKTPVEALFVNNSTFGQTGVQLEYNGGNPRAFFGNPNGDFLKLENTLTWKAANTELDSEGKLTATSFTVNSGTISGQLTIGTNGKILAGTADGNRAVVSSIGVEGYGDISGVTTRTFFLPTDGSPPMFSSGTIKEAEFQVYESGIIKTKDSPSTNGGLEINNQRLTAYNSNGLKLHEFIFGGTDEGDAYIGDYDNGNQGLKYDHSAGTFNFRGAIIAKGGSEVDGGYIVANTITATEIAAGTITANEIDANTITASEIASNTITATEISVSKLSAISADIGTVTAGKIQSGNYDGSSSGFEIDMDTPAFNIYDSGGLQVNASDGIILMESANIKLVGSDTSPGKLIFSSQSNTWSMAASYSEYGIGAESLALYPGGDGNTALNIGDTETWDTQRFYEINLNTSNRIRMNTGNFFELSSPQQALIYSDYIGLDAPGGRINFESDNIRYQGKGGYWDNSTYFWWRSLDLADGEKMYLGGGGSHNGFAFILARNGSNHTDLRCATFCKAGGYHQNNLCGVSYSMAVGNDSTGDYVQNTSGSLLVVAVWFYYW